VSKRTTRAYIALGSNLDHPARQVEVAFEMLDDIGGTRLVQRSSLYRSSPLGGIEQPDFVNAVAVVETTLSAVDLFACLQDIERIRGREDDRVRWGPRVLDLDLLVYGDAVVDEPNLKIPHPGIGARNFVLLPLREVAPDLDIPGLGCVSDLAVNEREPHISRIA
jgi:2-amino-4-hydroxy-6-hydroxymethyldihydropteridine diphosphokinase